MYGSNAALNLVLDPEKTELPIAPNQQRMVIGQNNTSLGRNSCYALACLGARITYKVVVEALMSLVF